MMDSVNRNFVVIRSDFRMMAFNHNFTCDPNQVALFDSTEDAFNSLERAKKDDNFDDNFGFLVIGIPVSGTLVI